MCKMLSIALNVTLINKKEYLIALSILFIDNGSVKIENFYWPQLISSIKIPCMHKDETFLIYNGHVMIRNIRNQEFIDNIMYEQSSFINEELWNVIQYLQILINRHKTVIMHENDVNKWLKLDFLSGIELKHVVIVKVDYLSSPICYRNNQHNSITCTICKCFNTFNNLYCTKCIYYGYTSFQYFAYANGLITEAMYWCLSRKRSMSNTNVFRIYYNDTSL